MSDFTKDDAEEIASMVSPIVELLKVLEPIADFEKWGRALQLMRGNTSRLEAFPWPATQNKAVEMAREERTFKALFDLFRVYRECRTEAAAGPRFLDDSDILRRLGLG
jgi:hypothetical protein